MSFETRAAVRAVTAAGGIAFAGSVLLLFVLALSTSGLGASGVSATSTAAVAVAGTLVRVLGGYLAGRMVRRRLDRPRTVLLAGAGAGTGYVVMAVIGFAVTLVVAYGQVGVSFAPLLGLVRWTAEGAAGGILAVARH